MKNIIKDRPIKVGVIGIGRGMTFARTAKHTGMELVALCDIWEEKLYEVGKSFNAATYTDYDKFLEHDMDAVILANYFHEHAPFAIKALKAGKHVMSETSCNSTLAEGVELCRTVEETGLIYMLAENYPYTKFNQEMRRIYQTGEIGEVAYAEGEYNHPMEARESLKIAPGRYHWRTRTPSTYYCTHALAPLMYITDTMPVKVNALSIVSEAIRKRRLTLKVSDQGSVILCRMNNGAVFRLFGNGIPGHSNWYRVHGSKGAMEITRGPGYFGPEQVRVWHEKWDLEPGQVLERTYVPNWPEHGELAERTGHGGGDFWTNFYFAQAIRTGEQPYLDVYRGVAMSSVGILAWRSALQDGAPVDVPDFSNESERKKYENDHWSPYNPDKKAGHPYSSILGELKPSKEAEEYARKIWTEAGFKDVDKLLSE